jgi:hypothetical protein
MKSHLSLNTLSIIDLLKLTSTLYFSKKLINPKKNIFVMSILQQSIGKVS